MKKTFLGLALMALLGIACEDELAPTPDVSDRIGYDVSVNKDGWQTVATRGEAVGGKAPVVTVSPMNQTLGGKPLYLHTTIESPMPDEVKGGGNSMAQTRGSELTAISQFNYSAGVYDGTWSESVTMTPFVTDERVDLNQQGEGFTNHFWPKNHSYIRFYAASLNDGGQGVNADGSFEVPEAKNEPTFDYVVPNMVSRQCDLLTTSGEYAGDYCKAVPLTFDHALTAVYFKLGEMSNFTIKSLTLRGVKNSGTYSFACVPATTGEDAVATHDAGGWSNQAMVLAEGATTTAYTLYFGTDNTDAENPKLLVGEEQGELDGWTYNGDIVLNDEEKTYALLMMPQELTADAEVVISGFDAILDKEVELVAKIGVDASGNALNWEKGKRVTYTLSLSDMSVTYYFNVEEMETDVKASEVPWYGATGLKYQVTDSYKIITRSGKNSEKYAVDWKAVYPGWVDEPSIPGETLQKGVVSSQGEAPIVGTYGVVTTDYEARLNTIGWNETYNDAPSSTILREKSEEGTDTSPYDLSTKGGNESMNTANCYIVSAPGYYKLPLVYGNAIQNGSDAPNSYSTSVGQGTATETLRNADGTVMAGKSERSIAVSVLENFKDHNDEAIQTPWIVSSRAGKYVAASAEIVWQDEPCLLTEVKLCGSDYLQFHVRKDCITEGNAVVAVKDENGVIMWSWHIWVTDYRNIYDTNYSGVASFSSSTKVVNRKVHQTTNASNWVLEENSFHIMKAHIGHCDGEVKSYSGRTGEILFVQVENGVEKKRISPISIVQAGGSVETQEVVTVGDNAVYYQWGRKDPMPGAVKSGESIIDKPCYGNDRTPVTAIIKGGGQATFGEAIRNPNTYYRRSDNDAHAADVWWYKWWEPTGIIYYNLWNSQSNSLPMLNYFYSYEPEEGVRERGVSPDKFFDEFEALMEKGVTKTVYDPCPPGYEMPRMDVFTGMTYDGIRRANYFDKETNTLKDYVNVMPESISTTAYTYDENGVMNAYWPATLNALSFYVLPMKQSAYYKRADGTDEAENQTYLVQALGYRSNSGDVGQYGVYGCALTSGVMCVQWENSNAYFNLQPVRLHFTLNNWSVIRPISGSDFDLAFGVIAAETGKNPDSSQTRFVTETELKEEYKARYPNAQ